MARDRGATTKGQYSIVKLEQTRLVSSFCIWRSGNACLLNLAAFENKKYTAYDRFYGNGPYRKDRKNIDQGDYYLPLTTDLHEFGDKELIVISQEGDKNLRETGNSHWNVSGKCTFDLIQMTPDEMNLHATDF